MRDNDRCLAVLDADDVARANSPPPLTGAFTLRCQRERGHDAEHRSTVAGPLVGHRIVAVWPAKEVPPAATAQPSAPRRAEVSGGAQTPRERALLAIHNGCLLGYEPPSAEEVLDALEAAGLRVVDAQEHERDARLLRESIDALAAGPTISTAPSAPCPECRASGAHKLDCSRSGRVRAVSARSTDLPDCDASNGADMRCNFARGHLGPHGYRSHTSGLPLVTWTDDEAEQRRRARPDWLTR
ncbi:MAG: hypothetical protein IT374_26145 [Polyangiaceae bacterium]|nr:hypothetical protein [Polyangiaceae bacterium]